MEGRMDGQMDGRTDGRTDGWTDGRMNGWMDGGNEGINEMDGWTDGWKDEWTDGQMDGTDEWMIEQMDGWMDGWMVVFHLKKHLIFFILYKLTSIKCPVFKPVSSLLPVVYVCCKLQTFRKLMVQFRKQQLPQEEYVFFFIDLFGESVQRSPAKPWVQGDADDHIAKEAFKSVKILTYREPQNPEYKTFVSRLKTDAKKMFNFTIEDSLVSMEKLKM
ncbi:hypothetical protein QTP70_001365 [Hemibagrus guttatus]|uniref:Receptor ligand binding region domain-containing protein n=1 Tax=Hemibagrus guttatus TaxID=175788 RepID=A0AAE0UK77_9TELE|nr:hypothetical protein QTP70_001365 [Hemibagrus guttatus]